MGGNKNGAPGRSAFLIGSDDGLDELPADDWVESRSWFIQHEQIGFGTNCADQRELRSLAFRERVHLLGWIELKTFEQFIFCLPVPLRAEGGKIFERLAHSHPWI